MSKITGTFVITKGNKEVFRSSNIITDAGRIVILKYMSGGGDFFADSLAIGVDTSAPATTDTGLGFEVSRLPITVSVSDPENSKVLFKSSFPEGIQLKINEIGLFSSQQGDNSYLHSTFGLDEQWEGELYTNNVDTRIGLSGTAVDLDANSTVTISKPTISNLSYLGSEDVFRLAVILYDDNCESIAIKFTDIDGGEMLGTYAIPTYTSSPDPQYEIIDLEQVEFSGLTNLWGSITKMDMVVVSKVAGATTIVLDGLRIIDNNIQLGSEIIAKTGLSEEVVKLATESLEVQYSLSVPI